MTADRTTETPVFPTCSSCGEYRGLEHDSQRCWTIAHALVVAQSDHSSEASRHIAELRQWLSGHPKQRGTQQYIDRETSLTRWIAVAQRGGER